MNALETHALDALSSLGSAWRGDWSDFDGRTLRAQLNSWMALMERTLAGETTGEEIATWIELQGICPRCHSWWEHCLDRDAHSANPSGGAA